MTRLARTAFAALLLTASTAAAAAPGTRDYTVTIAGRTAGSMSVTEEADGTRRTAYSVVDRGRGPEIKATARLDAAKLPQELTVGGVDYYKVPVDESFRRMGASGEWQSASDSGTTAAKGFYLPAESNSEHVAMLARALLAAPDRTLDLLPAGRARLTPSIEHRLPNGRTARLHLIENVGFRPVPVWLDTADNELIAEGATWIQTIAKDVAAAGPALVKLQEEVIERAERDTAKRLARKPKGGLLIRDARLFVLARRRCAPTRMCWCAATASSPSAAISPRPPEPK